MAGPPPGSRWSSIAVAGRLDEAVFDLALDIEVCGRAPYDDGGRTPGPTLLAKLLAEVFLEEEDCGRDDVDEAIDVLRALVREVPLTTERPGAKLVLGRTGSPARSTSVFRFGSSLLAAANGCISWACFNRTEGHTEGVGFQALRHCSGRPKARIVLRLSYF